MIDTESIVNNEFLRQFEYTHLEHLAKIEYSLQDRKIFLTKLNIPDSITEEEFTNDFIKAVLDIIKEKDEVKCHANTSCNSEVY